MPTFETMAGPTCGWCGGPHELLECSFRVSPSAYCTTCGHTYDTDSRYCTNCGKPKSEVERTTLELVKCRECSNEVTAKATYCGTEPTDAMGSISTILPSGDRGPNFPLTLAGETAIGRTSGDITFKSDRYLSPKHLEVKAVGDRIIARDLDSLNGTYLPS
jgi:hypothetical protein